MDLADDVFQTLPEKSEEAYNWIVRGLLKVSMVPRMIGKRNTVTVIDNIDDLDDEEMMMMKWI